MPSADPSRRGTPRTMVAFTVAVANGIRPEGTYAGFPHGGRALTNSPENRNNIPMIQKIANPVLFRTDLWQMQFGKDGCFTACLAELLMATGNRQQATGNRQQATGNRQLYTPSK